MVQLAFIKRNTYQDSVRLMRLTERVKRVQGVVRAMAIMGTENNKFTMSRAGFDVSLMKEAKPNDILFLVEAQSQSDAQSAWELYQNALGEHKEGDSSTSSRTVSVHRAAKLLKGANLALISVPGNYAPYEAYKALREGLHVHIFSDNVSLEDEIRLKELGRREGLLVMGPDCGTSIINGVPICFANEVARGTIGIVGASGTGIQEVSVLIDKLSAGVSHAIGVGGRDLTDEVGGITSLMALDLMETDPETHTIVLLSKLPGTKTLDRLTEKIRDISKPVVLCFLGVNPQNLHGVKHFTDTLEGAALEAVKLSRGNKHSGGLAFSSAESESENALLSKLPATRKYIRGLYSGGSLASETFYILKKYIEGVHFNPQSTPSMHAIVDMGSDEFTQGRPHPMIDPSYRTERLLKEWNDPEVAIILLDVVLGYGSHENPAAPLADSVIRAREKYNDNVIVIASVCGTERDPQQLSAQETQLREAGVLVYPTNARAAEAAVHYLSICRERSQIQ